MEAAKAKNRFGINAAKNKRLFRYMWKYKALYIISLPGILFFIVFKYVPLFGSIIAFQDYDIFRGFLGSEWVGLEHFKRMFSHADFLLILRNTVLIGLYDLIFAFPAPIILALLLNELRLVMYKRLLQTVVYMPHFLSWVVISGIALSLLSPSTGLVNEFIVWLGFEPIYFLGEESWIRSILVGSGIWRDTGYSMIIYLAALAGINPELYEAAKVDGANRWRQTISITIPVLMPTIMILFLLQIGNFLDFGFERVYVFLNSLNRTNGEIFDTYIYQVGLLGQQFSYTTAIGLFKSVVGLILIFVGNFISRKTTGEGLF